VSQTIKNSKHCAPNVQSYAIAGVRKPSGLFAPL